MDNRRSLVPKEGVVVVVAVVVAVVVVDVEEVSTKRAVDVLLFCFLEGRDMLNCRYRYRIQKRFRRGG